MSTRRMFSKKIINSAKFIKMPPSTQMLYFHLGLNADDDGVVEAFGIMRMLGCSEDDLKILVAKNFVKILNEDLVTYILDWHEHNNVRADRKVDSIYKDLLLQMVIDIKLVESKPRSDLKNKPGQSTGSPRTENGPHRLGKDRIGKEEKNIKKEKSNATKVASVCDFDLSDFNEEEIESIKSWIDFRSNNYGCKKTHQAIKVQLNNIRDAKLSGKDVPRMVTYFIEHTTYQNINPTNIELALRHIRKNERAQNAA